MLRHVWAFLGISLLSLLSACAEGPPPSDDYQASAYDPGTTYYAVADRPNQLYFFGPGCGDLFCASFVPVRVGYWPTRVVYYDSFVTRNVVTHDRWVSAAGGHWNRNTLVGHSGWTHHGPAVRPGGNTHNVNYTPGNGTRGPVHNDGRGHVSPPSGGRTPPHVTPPAPPRPTVHQPSPPRTTYTPPRPPVTHTPPPRPAPVRRCGGYGQPRC